MERGEVSRRIGLFWLANRRSGFRPRFFLDRGSRRKAAPTLTELAILIFLVIISSASVTAALPNVIIMFCDDMGYADIGPFGAKGYETPNLDRLAAEGMAFTDFHVGQSFCSPSRATLMTGCYPLRIGIPGNFGPTSITGLNPDELTIAEVLKQKGYATAMFGKWHLGHLPKFLPTSQGFDEWFGIPYSNDMWPYHPDPRYNFPDLPLMEGEEVLNPAIQPKEQVQLTTWFTERAVSFIVKNQERPFFIYLPHPMPHVPLYASNKYLGKTDTTYGDVISEIDWSVGEILSALERLDIDDNTLFVFTSDNGPWLLYGNHGGSAGPLREGKGTRFEGGFRVPCVMRWPEKIPSGSICSELAGSMDLMPTLAAMLGVRLPQDRIIDGKDIRPLMYGESGASSPHEAFYYFSPDGLVGVRSGKWKMLYPHNYNVPSQPGMDGVHGQYEHRSIELALFDLDSDVGEQKNVANQYPEVIGRLEGLAEAARRDIGSRSDPGPNVRPIGR
jgi:arylsulfatase A